MTTDTTTTTTTTATTAKPSAVPTAKVFQTYVDELLAAGAAVEKAAAKPPSVPSAYFVSCAVQLTWQVLNAA